jgi:hypothetical protein
MSEHEAYGNPPDADLPACFFGSEAVGFRDDVGVP